MKENHSHQEVNMMSKKGILLLVSLGYFSLGVPAAELAKAHEKVQIHMFIAMSQSEKENPNSVAFQLADQYNQTSENIELVLDITTASCSFDAADSLLQRIENGTPPDISYLRYRELWKHYLDLTPYLTDSFLNSMDTTMLRYFRINNRQVFLPTGYANRLFYYNKKLFDEAGLAYPPGTYSEPYADGSAWDINKLEEIAGLLTLDNEGRHAGEPEFDRDHISQYGFHWGWLNGIGMVQMFGPAQFITENEKVAVSGHTRQGYAWVHHAIWESCFAPNMSVFTDVMDERPIRSEKCAMLLSYVDNACILRNTSVDWDIAAIPSYNGTHHVPWGIGGYAILDACQHPAEAIDVIMYIVNIQDLYTDPDIIIPMKKNLRENIINSWSRVYPDKNLQVILDGFDHRSVICDGEALQFRMEPWRLVNDYRDYLWQEPGAQVAGALDDWLIPAIENIIKSTNVDSRNMNIVPEKFQLFQNFPNPFNPATRITYRLDRSGHIKLKIVNISGQVVDVLVNEFKPAGEYTVSWEPAGLSGGIYLCGLQAGSQMKTMKLIYAK